MEMDYNSIYYKLKKIQVDLGMEFAMMQRPPHPRALRHDDLAKLAGYFAEDILSRKTEINAGRIIHIGKNQRELRTNLVRPEYLESYVSLLGIKTSLEFIPAPNYNI